VIIRPDTRSQPDLLEVVDAFDPRGTFGSRGEEILFGLGRKLPFGVQRLAKLLVLSLEHGEFRGVGTQALDFRPQALHIGKILAQSLELEGSGRRGLLRSAGFFRRTCGQRGQGPLLVPQYFEPLRLDSEYDGANQEPQGKAERWNPAGKPLG
jgi:hypothetical protein